MPEYSEYEDSEATKEAYCDSDSADSDPGSELPDDDVREQLIAQYESLFSDDAGFLRGTNDAWYQPDELQQLPDLSGILSRNSFDETDSESNPAASPTQAEAQPLAAPPSNLGPSTDPTTSKPPTNLDPESVLPATDVGRDGEVYRLKPSRATKFLQESVGVYFPVPTTMNRAELVRIFENEPQLAELKIPASCLQVGYACKEAVGVALVMVSDELLRGRLLSVWPNSALTPGTAAFARMFAREDHVRGTAPAGPVGIPGKRKVKVDPLQELAACMGQHGGLATCCFISVDVEAAVILPGSIPLPLEFAFVEVSSMDAHHFFTHPGFVADDKTAMTVSACTCKFGHGIPFRDCAFLDKDYLGACRRLTEFLSRYRNVILVNKSSIIDLNAIRWLWAAAELQASYARHEIPQVPPYPNLPMFDIGVLEELTGMVSDLNSDMMESYRVHSSCAYHASFQQFARVTYDDYPVAHCALADAKAVADAVKTVLAGNGKPFRVANPYQQ